MTGLIFAVAVFLTLAVITARGSLRRLRSRARTTGPGHSPDNPIGVNRFDEIDSAVRAERCPCGGRLQITAEGGEGHLRWLHATCEVCEEQTTLYFDLTRTRH